MDRGTLSRRELLKAGMMSVPALSLAGQSLGAGGSGGRPNLVFVSADQWRAEATGYAGNPDVRTPHLDALAAQSVNFTTAVSGCSVNTYRTRSSSTTSRR